MRIGIMGAMELEIEQLLAAMRINEEQTVAGIKYYIGILGGQEIVLTCCGVSKVNAACSAQILISCFGVSCIINTGVAGSMDRRVGIKDIVISSDVTYHDVSVRQMQNCFPFMESFTADPELVQLCIESCSTMQNRDFNYYSGRIVTGEFFVSDPEKKREIKDRYQPLCVEMEGGAIGHACYLNKIPFLVIRCISDLADENAELSFDTFEQEAAMISSGIVIRMLSLWAQ